MPSTRSWSTLARRALPAALAVVASLLLVGALFVHLSRRSDLLEDVLAVPLTGTAAVEPLTKPVTTLPLSRTPVARAGDVVLRASLPPPGPSPSRVTLTILGREGAVLATCRYPGGTLVDTNVMRCPVRDLSAVRRVRIALRPKTGDFAIVGSRLGVGSLIVHRSHTFGGKLRTIMGRIGSKHPAAFSAWLVPLGTVAWLSALLLVGFSICRPSRPQPPDEGAAGDG